MGLPKGAVIMYISPTIIRIICAALWIGALFLALHLHYSDGKYSHDLERFLNAVSIIMALIGLIVGSWYGLFPSE